MIHWQMMKANSDCKKIWDWSFSHRKQHNRCWFYPCLKIANTNIKYCSIKKPSISSTSAKTPPRVNDQLNALTSSLNTGKQVYLLNAQQQLSPWWMKHALTLIPCKEKTWFENNSKVKETVSLQSVAREPGKCEQVTMNEGAISKAEVCKWVKEKEQNKDEKNVKRQNKNYNEN